MINKTFDYVLLRAMPDIARHEILNAGVVVFDAQNTCVRVDSSNKRLPHLHPDFGRINFSSWAEQIQTELRKHPVAMQHTLLPLLCAPFIVDKESAQIVGQDVESVADFLFERFVGRQQATIPQVRKSTTRPTKLARELRDWFKRSKVFSNKVEDLSKKRVVGNYPVSPATDLYADFALMNGKLHVIETLDLRGVDHLTLSLRGDAAIKGITLDEVKADDSNTIAIVAASDYSIARPAISMISRYANDMYDLSTQTDRQRLADFIAQSLHRNKLTLPLQQ